MFILVRRSIGIVLGVLIVLGPLNLKVQAQPRPGMGALPLNPNLNPFAAASRFNAAPLGGFLNANANRAMLQTGGLLNSPLAWGGGITGAGFGFRGLGGFGALGYGNLLNGGMGGYGLMGAALSGAAWGYGSGFGFTQWM